MQYINENKIQDATKMFKNGFSIGPSVKNDGYHLIRGSMAQYLLFVKSQIINDSKILHQCMFGFILAFLNGVNDLISIYCLADTAEKIGHLHKEPLCKQYTVNWPSYYTLFSRWIQKVSL